MVVKNIKRWKGTTMTLKLNVELPVFLLFFATNFAGIITKNFIIYSTCYVTLKYNESECALLGVDYTSNSTKDLEDKVQPHAAQIFTTISAIEAIFAPSVCFFLGPWSDKYGRKPILLLTLGGTALSSVVKTIISAIPNISPWWIFLSIVPSCISGGTPAAITAILCYITDVTTEQERVVKIFFFEGLVAVGSMVGSLVCSPALLALGYVGVFGISTVCVIVAWIYVTFILSESVENIHTEGKIRNLFSLSVLAETVKTITKKRENYLRGLIIAILLLLSISLFVMFGESEVMFLFVRKQFSWTLQKYTFYSTLTGITSILGGTISICVLYKLLRLKETTILILAFLFCMTGTLFQSLAAKGWEIYVGGSIKFLSGAISAMARSLLSKIIPVQDSGKIFSVLTSLESAAAILGIVVYTAIYKVTLDVFPSAFFFLTLGLDIIVVIILCVIILLQRYRRQVPYNDLEKDT